MKITHEQFQESFYYIAPGKDFEPLLRFSHECRCFLYANLLLTKADVLGYIERFFTENPFLELEKQTVCDDFDEITHFELHPDYRAHLKKGGQLFGGREGYSDYRNAFAPALKKEQWMIKLDFRNKRLNRPMALYYFTGEGLASYILLSQNGAYAPKVLATVQTGVLESKSDGTMSRLFELADKHPSQWIRGFERSDLFRHGRKYNDALDADPVFNTVGMDFAFKWNVEGSFVDGEYPKSPSIRFCKSFITEQYAGENLARPFKDFGRNAVAYGDLYELAAKDDVSKTLVITTRHFDADRLRLSGGVNLLLWEDILKNLYPWKSKFSLKQSLKELTALLKSTDAEKVFFVPFGMEDEGELLAEFLSKEYRPRVIVVVNRPLDYRDLRVS